MKKFMICAAVVLAAGIMTSCNKDTNRCWELTTTVTVAGISSSTTTHIWGSQNELDAAIANAEAQFGKENVTFDYKRTSLSVDECR